MSDEFTITDGALRAMANRTTVKQYLKRKGIVYSHRNGETEPPNITGNFWFAGKIHHRDYFHEKKGLLEITDHYLSHELIYDGEECCHRMGDFEGQWWGPIVTPWEQTP